MGVCIFILAAVGTCVYASAAVPVTPNKYDLKKRKEKCMLYSNHSGSLLRQQPGRV